MKITRIIIYNIRVKVGDMMKYEMCLLEQFVKKADGLLITADALQQGISKDQIYRYIRENDLGKVGRGIYAVKDAWIDEMYLLQLRFPRAVYSYDTALYLHDLAEKEPIPLTVTVPAKYNTISLNNAAKIYYVKEAWYSVGVCEVESPEGNKIKVYDRERTICDIIRKRENMDTAVFNYALKEYVKSLEKDYSRLLSYAKIFRMESKLRNIMGVLL